MRVLRSHSPMPMHGFSVAKPKLPSSQHRESGVRARFRILSCSQLANRQTASATPLVFVFNVVHWSDPSAPSHPAALSRPTTIGGHWPAGHNKKLRQTLPRQMLFPVDSRILIGAALYGLCELTELWISIGKYYTA